MRRALACLLALAAVPVACRRAAGPPPFTAPVKLGGRVVAPAALEHGRDVYTSYCRPCHGDAGDGHGTAAPALRPPPRDLRLGIYKFGYVPAGQLPVDADFVRIIKGGLHGTAMLAWQVPDAELDDLIQYVKAFAPRWRDEAPGQPIAAPPDPWAADERAGVERGKVVYHGMAQCATACHPAYVPRSDIYSFTKDLTHMEVRAFRPDLYDPVLKESDFGFKILPPDFTFNVMRGGDDARDIYRAIAAGIGGNAMPTWKNVLPDADLWAMAHYVRSLVGLRGTPAAAQLRRDLLAQPAWAPPPLPTADGGGE